jgi:hypothetical protein
LHVRPLLALSVALAMPLAFRAAQSTTADAKHPAYTFARPVHNGMGLSSLSELQGKPVLVEFWGTR